MSEELKSDMPESDEESPPKDDGQQQNTESPPATTEKPVSKPELTSIPQPPTLMEVHHPHHPTHKKKWSEYLLEFFMLFLAVFLGFIAENIREESVEHHREKEYIHSICEDIKSDTLQSGRVLSRLNKTLVGLDSIMDALSSPEVSTNSNNVYRIWNKYIGFADFVSNDGTIQQLKNSGGLRLIRNKAVADSIMKYDAFVKAFNMQATLMNGALADQHIYSQLFDFISLKKNPDSPVPLTEQGKKMLNEAYANRRVWKYGIGSLVYRLEDVYKEGKSILKFIQEQYMDE
ncbi:MAG: hypothetical protein QM764_22805 [Chitinophagaceae bacterium]